MCGEQSLQLSGDGRIDNAGVERYLYLYLLARKNTTGEKCDRESIGECARFDLYIF